MSRKSPKDIRLKTNIRCLRIYPVEKSSKNISELNTIGIKLNREQAIHLARVLLAVSQDWDDIEITGYRFKESSSDGTYPLTVSSHKPEED